MSGGQLRHEARLDIRLGAEWFEGKASLWRGFLLFLIGLKGRSIPPGLFINWRQGGGRDG